MAALGLCESSTAVAARLPSKLSTYHKRKAGTKRQGHENKKPIFNAVTNRLHEGS